MYKLSNIRNKVVFIYQLYIMHFSYIYSVAFSKTNQALPRLSDLLCFVLCTIYYINRKHMAKGEDLSDLSCKDKHWPI